MDKTTYSEWIFGASKGNEVIGKLLETFAGNGHYKDILYPLAARIKNILTVLYEVPLNGSTCLNGEVFTVYSPEILVFNPYEGDESATVIQICEHDFSGMDSEEYCTVKKSTIGLQTKGISVNRVVTNQGQGSLDSISFTEYQNMKSRLEAIENSDSMRLTLWLYRMGNKFTLPKKIVKKMLHWHDN